VLKGLSDPASNDKHFSFFHSAGGECGGADADSTWLHGRVFVVGNGVFVDGDSGFAKRVFGLGAEDSLFKDVDEHEVGVCAAGDDAIPFVCNGFCKYFGVGDDLFCVGGKLRLQRFFERNCLCCNDVHQRAALLAGKDAAVDASGEFLPAEDHSGAGAAEGFVGRGGDDVSVGDR